MAEAASPKHRAACSFGSLLLTFLNFTLFLLAAASVAPIVALRSPPAPLGVAFLMLSSLSLLSAFVGFYAQLTHFCFVFHVSLLLASSAGQLLGVLALFTREETSLSMLRSPRDPREAKLLVRVECVVLVAMLVSELGVLILSCAVHSCRVKEYKGLERRRIARVQEESMADAAEAAELKSLELDEKVKGKCGQAVGKNDLEV